MKFLPDVVGRGCCNISWTGVDEFTIHKDDEKFKILFSPFVCERLKNDIRNIFEVKNSIINAFCNSYATASVVEGIATPTNKIWNDMIGRIHQHFARGVVQVNAGETTLARSANFMRALADQMREDLYT